MTPFWGKYRGIVTDTDDPSRIGRIKARVPDVFGPYNESGWAVPCAPFGGRTTGFFALPPVGAGVWMEFEFGDPQYPIWTGCLWGTSAERPSELMLQPAEQVMIVTAGGMSITLSDVPGKGGITLETATGAKIAMTSSGIELDNGQGATLKLSGPSVSVNNGALDVT